MLRLAPCRRSLPRATPLTLLLTTTTKSRPYSSSFIPRPAPPKLPADQQAEFERLQRAASVSAAFQPGAAAPPSTQQPRHATDAATSSSNSSSSSTITTTTTTTTTTSSSSSSKSVAADDDNSVNQGLFRGAKPEFQGDTNPKTGEVGGPKNEPLRWGGQGDWSYNGRVTDF